MGSDDNKSSKLSWTQYALVGTIIALNAAILYGLVRLTPLGDHLKSWESEKVVPAVESGVKKAKELRDEVVGGVGKLEKQVA